MNAICVICSDHLTHTDDIFHTPCGHVFHHNCLVQWLERSKTCPQCREKVREAKIHRLFFTHANNDTIEENSASLQERIDNLKFKILLKEKDIKHYTSKVLTLEKQNSGLRKEVRKLESETSQKNAVIHALKQQVMYFKGQISDYAKIKKELESSQKKIDELKDVQVLLNAPVQDVSEMFERNGDPVMLRKYILVIKKELISVLNRCKQLQITIRRLREGLSNIGAQEKEKRSKLEMTLALCQSEKCYLQQLFEELKEKLKNNGDASFEIKSIERLLKKPMILPEDCLETDTSDMLFATPEEPVPEGSSTIVLENTTMDTNLSIFDQLFNESEESDPLQLTQTAPAISTEECGTLHTTSSGEISAKRRRVSANKRHSETNKSDIHKATEDSSHGSSCSEQNKKLRAKRTKAQEGSKNKKSKSNVKETKSRDSIVDLTADTTL